MLSSIKSQAVLPGIMCNQIEQLSICEKDNVVQIDVAPQKGITTKLCFSLTDDALNKKYHLSVNFKEPHANVEIRGLYQLAEKQFVDIEATMNHFVPHCTSNQIWKGVLRDSAKAKFDGKIVVHSGAQKTVAHLKNKNLLLSKTAEINTKPTLEIYADDVQCSHGATVGFLDEQALFYLRSRGIDEHVARELLIDAFKNDINMEE